MVSLPESKIVHYKGKTFTFAESKSVMDLMKGLAGIESLEEHEVDGMLFDFSTDHDAVMTPRGLQFPVEVAFIDTQGVIQDIQTLEPRFGHNVFSANPVRYALEVPVGFFEEHNIAVGTRIEI